MILFVTIIFLLISAGTVIVFLNLNKKTKEANLKSDYQESLQSFKIFLPEVKSIKEKEIYLKKDGYDLQILEKILENYIKELSPPIGETKILGIYRDRENLLYLDFSKNFILQTDANDEYIFLTSFYKTIKNNFPWIKDIKILIEGKQIETVGGHISIAISLKEALEEQ